MNCSQNQVIQRPSNNNLVNCPGAGNFLTRVKKAPVADFSDFQRIKYDAATVENELRTASRLTEYLFDPIQIHACQPCRSDDIGTNSKFGVSYNANLPLVDTESQLRNLNVPLNHDTSVEYVPQLVNQLTPDQKDCRDRNLYHFRECSLGQEYTRLNNPAWTLKETGVNRFQPTYLNHQDRSHWEIQTPTLISDRQLARDNYVPRIPCPIDQSAMLPKGKSHVPNCQQVVRGPCDISRTN